MKINYIRKNIELDQINFKETVEDKFKKVEARKKGILEVKITTIFAANLHNNTDNDFDVEIVLFMESDSIKVKATSTTQIKAFDLAFEKIEKIIRRDHDKHRQKKQ